MNDPVGDMMKELEQVTETTIAANSWYVIRCDGRSFSRYTAKLPKPFDRRLADDMVATTKELAAGISGCVLGYTQSDEISLICNDLASDTTEHWFGGKVQKIVSSAAAFATVVFAELRNDLHTGRAMFDARAFPIDGGDILTYLAWRQADARRNAVSAMARTYLGHKAVTGVATKDRVAMLDAAGYGTDTVNPSYVNGTLVVPVVETRTVEYVHKTTGEHVVVDNVERRTWKAGCAPMFAGHAGPVADLRPVSTPLDPVAATAQVAAS
jgi:tRNA(His) guanylyltransferase